MNFRLTLRKLGIVLKCFCTVSFLQKPLLRRANVFNEFELLFFVQGEREANFRVQIFHYHNLNEARACAEDFF